ncbi:hypothetical protein DL95DRAFT_52072 [Leptodontidium sp. 2 PMI_412]|nr:hypothetical protein DL95DRAFT_52072 [Leptodontidium sp. 2 PMI_412]
MRYVTPACRKPDWQHHITVQCVSTVRTTTHRFPNLSQPLWFPNWGMDYDSNRPFRYLRINGSESVVDQNRADVGCLCFGREEVPQRAFGSGLFSFVSLLCAALLYFSSIFMT